MLSIYLDWSSKFKTLLYDKNETVEVNTIIAKIGTEGEENIAKTEDYNSHNTVQCGVEAIKKLLLQLDVIQNALDNINWKVNR